MIHIPIVNKMQVRNTLKTRCVLNRSSWLISVSITFFFTTHQGLRSKVCVATKPSLSWKWPTSESWWAWVAFEVKKKKRPLGERVEKKKLSTLTFPPFFQSLCVLCELALLGWDTKAPEEKRPPESQRPPHTDSLTGAGRWSTCARSPLMCVCIDPHLV